MAHIETVLCSIPALSAIFMVSEMNSSSDPQMACNAVTYLSLPNSSFDLAAPLLG
jgi:hypothetical protein